MQRARADAAIDGLEEVWTSLCTLGRALEPAQFDLPTECPGWTVKDQFSHVIGTELLLEGRPAPEPAGAPRDHVRNDLGELNERFVEERRDRTGSEVVAELAALSARRLDTLRALDEEAWHVLGPSPIGMVPYVDYMGVRTFDSWVHEQDVRRAVGAPGGRGGLGERITLDRMEASMPYVLGRRVAAPPGTTFRLDVTGQLGRTVQLVVTRDAQGKPRAASMPVIDGSPTATLLVDEETFVRRACGRITAGAVSADPQTASAGDSTLVEDFIERMVVMV
ncbi:MAG TPA: maleylpyruvate isomerase N-terminal domain-containing protein [Acidimicrobiales bacterium]